MIAWLSGAVRGKKPGSVIIETGGVGYLVHITLPTYYALPAEGGAAQLSIHTHVTDDDIRLFGFLTAGELAAFHRLIAISKVGPKLAMNVLSGIPVADLAAAVAARDATRLAAIPGVGKKTAERLILELDGKLDELAAERQPEGGAGVTGEEAEAVEALMALGYKRGEAREAVAKARQRVQGGLEDLVRAALAALAV